MPPAVIEKLFTNIQKLDRNYSFAVLVSTMYIIQFTDSTVSVFFYFLLEISCTILFKKVSDPVIASGML